MNRTIENTMNIRNAPRSRHVTLKALGMVALLAACGTAAAQPNDPVINLIDTGSATWNGAVYSPCTEEMIYFEVDQSWSLVEAFLGTPGSAGAHSIYNTQLHGVGIGEVTDQEYTIRETYHSVWNNNGLPADGPLNLGQRDHFSAVSRGPGQNLTFHFNSLCVTTPNAEYWFDCQVEFETVTLECRG